MVNATGLEVSDQKITSVSSCQELGGHTRGSVLIPSCGKTYQSALIYRKVILGFPISVGFNYLVVQGLWRIMWQTMLPI